MDKSLDVGSTVIIRFDTNFYLKFINVCFANMLISSARVVLESDEFSDNYIVIVTINAPGIDRIVDTVKEYDGAILCMEYLKTV